MSAADGRERNSVSHTAAENRAAHLVMVKWEATPETGDRLRSDGELGDISARPHRILAITEV